MRTIALTMGAYVKVDDQDYPWLCVASWRANPSKDGKLYARTTYRGDDGRRHTAYMQALIMQPPYGYVVYFKNGDTLDCRRENLGIRRKRVGGRRPLNIRPPKHADYIVEG